MTALHAAKTEADRDCVIQWHISYVDIEQLSNWATEQLLNHKNNLNVCINLIYECEMIELGQTLVLAPTLITDLDFFYQQFKISFIKIRKKCNILTRSMSATILPYKRDS